MATSRRVIATVNHTYARQGTRPMSQPNCDLVLAPSSGKTAKCWESGLNFTGRGYSVPSPREAVLSGNAGKLSSEDPVLSDMTRTRRLADKSCLLVLTDDGQPCSQPQACR